MYIYTHIYIYTQIEIMPLTQEVVAVQKRDRRELERLLGFRRAGGHDHLRLENAVLEVAGLVTAPLVADEFQPHIETRVVLVALALVRLRCPHTVLT